MYLGTLTLGTLTLGTLTLGTLTLGTLTAALLSSAQPKAPMVELITMGPGPYLYSFWGHAALRVLDPNTGRDVVYNFGSVDFSGGFFVRMMRGQVDAYVSTSSFNQTVAIYSKEDRTVTRRVLNLKPDEARAIALRLARFVGQDKSTYRYHHFEDNCATRVADEVDRALEGRLHKRWTESTGRSFRQHALGMMRPHTLYYAAIDLVLNGVADRPITVWQARFLPSLFVKRLDKETIDQGQGLKPVVRFQFDLHRSKSIEPGVEWTWPWLKIYLLFILPFCAVAYRFPRFGLTFWSLFGGLLGTTIVLLWLGTNYNFLAGNWNVLVLPPWGILVAICAGVGRLFKRLQKALWTLTVAHTTGLILLSILATSGVIEQSISAVLGAALWPGLILSFRLYPKNNEV